MEALAGHELEALQELGRNVPLLYEVRDEDLSLVERGVLRGAKLELDVASAGRFQLSVFAGGRRILRAPIRVTATDAGRDWELGPSRISPSFARKLEEQLQALEDACDEGAGFLEGLFCSVHDFFVGVLAWAKSALPGAWGDDRGRAPPAPAPQRGDRTEYRLWALRTTNAGWTWDVAELPSRARSARRIELEIPGDRVHVVQYAVSGEGLRHTVLPPGSVVLRLAAGDGARLTDAPIDVDVSDSVADNLMGFLFRGDLERARSIASAVLDEDAVFAGSPDPVAAVVGAYFLLRFGPPEQLEAWVTRLTEAACLLPDAAIVRGWMALRQGETTRARSEFLAALQGGLPLFTAGVQLLGDGLRLFPEDEALEAAGVLWRRYVNALRWTEPYVTFVGTAPNQPGHTVAPSGTIALSEQSSYRLER